jgi:hypothetical protein
MRIFTTPEKPDRDGMDRAPVISLYGPVENLKVL